MTAVAELVWASGCQLGEGTVWRVADQTLYFVDIHGCEVLAFTPGNGRQQRWSLPQRVGWLVPRRSGGWVAGLQQGVVALQLEPDGRCRIDWLHRVHPQDSPMRLNDGKADAWGRMWFGSMHNQGLPPPQGHLYRWEPDAAPVVVDAGYAVANGPATSAPVAAKTARALCGLSISPLATTGMRSAALTAATVAYSASPL